jgi:hypothetical protein
VISSIRPKTPKVFEFFIETTKNPTPGSLGYGLVCIDTACGYGGMLTALEVATGQVWQVNEQDGNVCRLRHRLIGCRQEGR